MNTEDSVETTGETIEEAIQKGLDILAVSPTEVIVDVVEEPVEGVFGMESRPARVRLRLMMRQQAPATSVTSISKPYEEATPITLPTSVPESAPPPASESRERSHDRDRNRGRDRQRNRNRDRQENRYDEETPAYMDIEIEEGEDAALPLLNQMDEVPETEYDEEVAIGKVVLGELLERLGIRGRIQVKRARPTDQTDGSPWILDVAGGNSHRLIGRRGDTLASLQYVARLITSRELQRRSEVIIDVDGYKARRAQQLHSLALRMATEAMQRGTTVALEPMPPHERRIIHLALRGHDDVTTKSVGEGASRKVTIVPKAQQT
jgi:spoIIIJ-associated protein